MSSVLISPPAIGMIVVLIVILFAHKPQDTMDALAVAAKTCFYYFAIWLFFSSLFSAINW